MVGFLFMLVVPVALVWLFVNPANKEMHKSPRKYALDNWDGVNHGNKR